MLIRTLEIRRGNREPPRKNPPGLKKSPDEFTINKVEIAGRDSRFLASASRMFDLQR
mgnify:FL=1